MDEDWSNKIQIKYLLSLLSQPRRSENSAGMYTKHSRVGREQRHRAPEQTAGLLEDPNALQVKNENCASTAGFVFAAIPCKSCSIRQRITCSIQQTWPSPIADAYLRCASPCFP